ncbi:hypothetical protein [Klebsiella pneumoniae]|uniref:hypothetical protein n=1 Tax=Klebsiella pneumoniae TaxID=573 RepID=UPI000BB320F1|nr:hypothetical protein [Klebsiella pneumoniae]PAX15012.1 hypothetical protein BVX91_01085 [Klebsiella pneumoniae]PIK07946.1 hypothetical protein CR533_01085 [Klebsiella pneumoniae]HDZ0981778.1 hypothetical protein [Klebsiella quasipneumoniae]HDZ1013282.1 hypothetical protein [Klebsiella quasipneumoniae]
MTDITELAQRMKAAAVRAKTATEEYASGHMSVSVCFAECEEFNRLTDGPDNIIALVEDLEKAQRRIAELENYAEAEAAGADRAAEDSVYWMKRCKELESRTVKLPKRHSMLLREDFNEDYHTEMAYKADEVYASLAAAGIKVEADSLDADVNDRNQPGMVVAVHIDVGDFVKFRGRVYEVKETDFDDHDVTLWFVCGEVLKCAAGCPIEVVSAPVEDE